MNYKDRSISISMHRGPHYSLQPLGPTSTTTTSNYTLLNASFCPIGHLDQDLNTRSLRVNRVIIALFPNVNTNGNSGGTATFLQTLPTVLF